MTDEAANSSDIIVATLTNDRMYKVIRESLPPWMPPERFMSAAISAIKTTPPEVWDGCDRASIYNAVARAARHGLLVDGVHGAIVPFRKRQKNGGFRKEVQYLIMPKGIVDSFARVGITAYAVSVYESDQVRFWNDAEGQHVEHTYNPMGDRGKYVGAFAVARARDGRTWVEAMGLAELEKVRQSSPAPDSPAWRNWPERMDQKSCLHRLDKRVPGIDVSDDMEPKGEPEAGISISERPTVVSAASLLESGAATDESQAQ